MKGAEDITEAVKRPAESMAAGASDLEVAKQIGEAGLRTAGATAGAILAPITEALSPVIKPLIEQVIKIPGVKENIQKVVEWAEQNPNAAKDLGSVLNIVAVKGVKLAEPVVKEAIGAGIKTGAETTGGILKSAGKKLYSVAVPMEQSTARAIQAYQATKPTLIERISGLFSKNIKETIPAPITEATTAARVGLAGTEWQLGVQAKRIASELWNKTIAPALSASKSPNDMRAFFSDLRDRIIAETPDLSRRKLLLKAWESMKRDYGKVNFVSDAKLQDYKSGWAKFVPEKVYQGKPIAGALNEVRNMAAQEARAIIYKKLGEGIKQAYIDYGNLQSIIEAGIKSVDPLRSKSAFRQAWEFILDKTVTPIATYGGKVLYRTGEGFEFIGGTGIKKVGDLLKD